MNIRTSHLSSRAALLGLLTTILTACAADPQRPTVAQADAGQSAQADATPVEPPPAATPPAIDARPPASTVSELQALIQSRQVTELRTTYNGTYGASLLFKPDDLSYYVTLFQQKNFWKVVKTNSEKQAEQLYAGYVAQTAELAEADLRRIKLQAEYAHTERQLTDRSRQLDALQADLTVQRQQAHEVAVRQQQAKQEASQLARQQQEAREQLRDLQRRIEALKRQQATLGATTGQGAGKPGGK